MNQDMKTCFRREQLTIMNFDCIFANSPYGKPGVDITKHIMENFPDANYAMLNTRRAFKKYYDKLACQFVQIGKYELGSNQKLDWGVEQAILLATNGRTEVVDNRKKKVGENKVGIENMSCLKGFQTGHISHLVGISIQTTRTASLFHRYSFLTETDKDVPPRISSGTRDYNLRNGYIYVSFETFEEACECAIDIISWTNPTDSHYRCIRWGFVTGLVSHERYKEEGEQRVRKINSERLSKKVRCVETGEIFESAKKASEITSIKNICNAARGARKTAGGYHWEYL